MSSAAIASFILSVLRPSFSTKPGSHPSATRRAAAAQAIPGAALTVEAASYSTLQNALFSKPALDGTDHLILVTEAWHLPRAWASFVWAGDQRLSLAWSARYGPPAQALRMIPREAAAIWFNAGRAALWQVAGWLSVPRARRDGWLQ
jgi:uncharacterized SAM-binding protein YcdF (DUF218 family)